GAALPLGEDDDLDVGEVRNGVQRGVPERPGAPDGERGHHEEGHQAVGSAPGDETRDHWPLHRGSASRSCASLPSRKVGPTTTRSPAERPARTWVNSPPDGPISTATGSRRAAPRSTKAYRCSPDRSRAAVGTASTLPSERCAFTSANIP